MNPRGDQRTLGAFVMGDGEFHAFHGLLLRLAERGNLNVRIISYSRFLRQRPHSKILFSSSEIQYVIRNKRLIELFPKSYLDGCDAVLVMLDPIHELTRLRKYRRKYRHIVENDLTTIHVGHSIYPEYWVRRLVSSGAKPASYYSKLMFEYEELPEFSAIHSSETLSKLHYSGLIKKHHVTPKAAEYEKLLRPYSKTVLFAHEFRTAGRFTDTQMFRYFEMVTAYAMENPDVALIMRPHRGRAKSSHKEFDAELRRKCPNVFFSNQKNGLFKNALANDLLAASDVVVSTPSTIIVDSIYMDVPVGVALNDDVKYDDFAQVNDLRSLTEFIANPNAYDEIYDRVRKHYGDVDDNIDKVCEKIESLVLNLPVRT